MANSKRNTRLHSRNYYQEIFDLRKKDSRLVIQLLEEVALAIEKSSNDKIKTTVANLIDKIEPRDIYLVTNDPHIDEVSDEFFYIIMSRLVFKDLLDSFSALANWWARQRIYSKGSLWNYRTYAWEGIVEITLYSIYHLKANNFSKHFELLHNSLNALLLEIFMSSKLKSAELRKLPWSEAGEVISLKGRQYRLTNKLIKLFKELFNGEQVIIQELLDEAITEIIKRKKPKKLEELNKINHDLFLLLKKHNLDVLSTDIDTTIIQNELHGGFYFDALLFTNTAKRRNVKLEYFHYDSEGDLNASGRHNQIIFAIRQRTAQISFIKFMFGLSSKGRTMSGRVELSNAELSNCMQKIGTNYSIHDNDIWVKIVIILYQKYEQKALKIGFSTTEVSDIALNASLQHFFSYLDVFTEHSKFDIRDFGKNYFDTIFPRTITGRRLHDCGVYALRIAYVIKQLSQKIKQGKKSTKPLVSNMYYIKLPFHVGLMVEFTSGSAIVIHNKDHEFFDKKKLKSFKTKWMNTEKLGKDISKTPAVFDKDTFIAELSAPLYVEGVDHPVLIVPIRLDIKTKKLDKRYLWFTYLRKVANSRSKLKLFSYKITQKNDPVYQFPMRYLELLEMRRVWYNKFIVMGFWNSTAFKAWNKHKPKLEKRFLEFKNASKNNLKKAFMAYAEERIDYLLVLTNGLIEVEESKKQMIEKQEKLNSDIDAYPYVLTKKVIRTYHRRLSLGNIHLGDVTNHMDEMVKHPSLLFKLPIPPFATKGDWLEPIPE